MIFEVMESKEGMSSDFTVKGDEAPQSSYMAAPRAESYNLNPNPNPNLNANSSPNPNPTPIPIQNPNPSLNSNTNPNQVGGAIVTADASAGSMGSGLKKKRGRPRKYAPDGSLNTALSPMPISASIPLTAGGTGAVTAWKRGKGRPVELVKKQVNINFQHENRHTAAGDRIAYVVGQNFMPHVLTVNTGEDVTMKIMSFSQQGARAICILSANGTISNVTLRQPTTSGGTLTYEGRFEILSLSGSYMPSENGGTKSRSGGMSVSLAGSDGRVVGGGLAGLLIAASPVQVVVGSFLPGHQQEHVKHKKQRTEHPPPPPVIPATVNIYSPEGTYGGIKPVIMSSASFHGNNSAPVNPVQAYKDPSSDLRISSPEDGSRGPDNSNYEVSC